MILVGYNKQYKAYHCLSYIKKQLIIFKDLVFNERKFRHAKSKEIIFIQ